MPPAHELPGNRLGIGLVERADQLRRILARSQGMLGVHMSLAREMLSGSEFLVMKIALEIGFSSGQHFAAIFKRLTGETAQSCRARQKLLEI